MPAIINIHGPIASGKSTTCKNLLLKLKDFSFVDRAHIKRLLYPAGKTEAKKISGKATILLLRELMKLNKNILVQEQNPIKIKKHLAKYLKNYSLHSFYLSCSPKEAIKRSKAREKKTSPINKIIEAHEKSKPTKLDTIIDTEKNSPNQVTKIIIQTIS